MKVTAEFTRRSLAARIDEAAQQAGIEATPHMEAGMLRYRINGQSVKPMDALAHLAGIAHRAAA